MANALLFKAVPGVMRTDRLVEISRDVAGEASDVTFSIFRHLRAQTTVLDDLAAYSLEAVSFSAGDDPGLRGAVVVTGNYFSMLGVAAARGRLSYRVVLYQTSHRGTP